jgi:hypothetical protein
VEEELHIPLNDRWALWWEQTAWWMGTVVGDTLTAGYKTTDGVPNPYLIPKFTWAKVADNTTVDFHFILTPKGIQLTTYTPNVSGEYVESGTYGEEKVYVQYVVDSPPFGD